MFFDHICTTVIRIFEQLSEYLLMGGSEMDNINWNFFFRRRLFKILGKLCRNIWCLSEVPSDSTGSFLELFCNRVFNLNRTNVVSFKTMP